MAERRAVPTCTGCGSELPMAALVCPVCQTIVHADRLRELARDAEACERDGKSTDAMGHLREALTLLPESSRQFAVVRDRVEALSRGKSPQPITIAATTAAQQTSRADAPPAASQADRPQSRKAGTAAALGTVGVLLMIAWKFKAVLLFLLTKGKLLLLGLTKGSTAFSMLVSLGAYWAIWGWKFALGLVVSIYIHEMGHVAALTRLGIKATPPMFIPGLGAMIRLKQYPTSPREDARVGLAGPIWGLGAALAAYGVSLASGSLAWAAIAKVGAWLNLFNLLPVFGLDGARGFRSLVRWQRWTVALAFVGAWMATGDGLLLLLALVAIGVAVASAPATEPDYPAFLTFLVLIASLSAISALNVPTDVLE
ncbi:MAG: site-2 protease family protein [Phycisphaerae bacterium]